MAMMSFKSMPGTKVASESDVSELLIAREAYELGCLISIGLEEIEGFERHFALVKSCYTDYAAVLPASENQQQLQGLNLLGLLAQSKIAEFHTGLTRPHHSLRPVFARCLVDLCDAALVPSAAYEWSCHLSLTPSLSVFVSLPFCTPPPPLYSHPWSELELIPVDLRENQYIKFPIQLEQYLMEGTYRKVEEVKTNVYMNPLIPRKHKNRERQEKKRDKDRSKNWRANGRNGARPLHAT